MSKRVPESDSTLRLTHFPPLSQDERDLASTFSWTRMFKRRIGIDETAPNSASVENSISSSTVNGGVSNSDPGALSEMTTTDPSDASSTELSTEQTKSSSSSGSDAGRRLGMKEKEFNKRSISTVLKHMSNILERRLATPQPFKDTDFKQYWMLDEDCKECYDCGDKFTTFRRRHHCRVCGQIFCSRCCNQEIPGKIIGCPFDLRVCRYCCKVVLSYVQLSDSDMAIDGSASDLRSLQEDLRSKLSLLDNESDSSTYEFANRGAAKRKNSLEFREQIFVRSRKASSIDAPIHPRLRDVNEGNTSELLTRDSVQLRDLWLQIHDPIRGITFHNHRHRLITHSNCVVASELVDWLIAEDKACSRLQAVAICQALTDSKYMEPVNSQDRVFLDEYALYRPGSIGVREASKAKANSSSDQLDRQDHGQEPTWVKEINQDAYGTGHDTDEYDELAQSSVPETFRRSRSSNSMFYVTLDPDESRVSLNRIHSTARSKLESAETSELCRSGGHQVQSTDSSALQATADDLLNGALVGNLAPCQDAVEDSSIPVGWHSSSNLRQDNDEKLAYERISLAYEQHENALLSQLLTAHGLSQSWAETILHLTRKVAETVRPDERHDCDEMDIRQYVQFKKIPSGKRSECAIINGVVFTKNVAHKNMQNNIMNPAILLVRSPIVYQRHENKLLSMEPAVLQEHNYLRNVVAKIASFKPSIVVAEKTVSRVAQDFLLDLNITLVLNVKPCVLERIARLTQGEVVSSIDAQLIRPHLGMCHNFKLVNYTVTNNHMKTLMFFDGCAQHLGCTVILRGASSAELCKVKQITRFMIYVYYNWRLERSFLMDEFAMPPPPLLEQRSFEMMHDEPDDDDGAKSVFGQPSVRDKPAVTENDVDDVITGSRSAVIKRKANGGFDGEVDRLSKERKCESQTIDDHSDPLRSYQKDEDHSNEEAHLENDPSLLQVSSMPMTTRSFRKALDDTVLSVSPYSKFSMPYLETKDGRQCKLRRYFPDDIYWSEQFHQPKTKTLSSSSAYCVAPQSDSNVADGDAPSNADLLVGLALKSMASGAVEVRSNHSFTVLNLRSPITDSFVQESLADFRARGGRIVANLPTVTASNFKKLNGPTVHTAGAVSKDNLENASGVALPQNTSNWQVDALDPINHQKISVLFSSYSYFSFNSPYFCVSPWLVNMYFYDSNDISLGGFLEKYCFRTTYVCPSESCDTPMTEHVRRFVSEGGCVHILLRKMKQPIRRWPESISTWSWCHRCKQVTNVVPMSLDTWSLSFAKYLELRFHGGAYLRRGALDGCTHSLHHDHYQYFAYRQIVTAFKYSSILLREVVLPESTIVCSSVVKLETFIEEIKVLSVKGHGVYGAILDRLFTLSSECAGTKQEQMVSILFNQLQAEKNSFKERMEEIQMMLTSPSVENVDFADAKQCKKNLFTISDSLVNLKRLVVESIAPWDKRFAELVRERKKDEKASRPTLGTIKTISAQVGSSFTSGLDSTVLEPFRTALRLDKDSVGSATTVTNTTTTNTTTAAAPNDSVLESSSSAIDEEHFYISTDDEKPSAPKEVERCVASSFTSTRDSTIAMPSSNERKVRTPFPVSPIATKFGETSVIESLDNSDCEVGFDGTSSDVTCETSRSKVKTSSLAKQGDESVEPSHGRLEKKTSGTVKNMLSQFLSASISVSLQNPFVPTEHYLLPRCEGISLVVYEDEPSSIIAYALISPDYELELQELRLATAAAAQQRTTDSRNSSPITKRKQNVRDSANSSGIPDGLSVTTGEPSLDTGERDCPTQTSLAMADSERDKSGQSKDKSGRSAKALPPSSHVEVQFTDGVAKFYCRIYFAEQFCRLRRLLFPDGEVAFARSLSRCMDWTPMGGKSGCTFCITQDDRFILKQMTRFEVQSFEDFALDYMDYISKACAEQRPTALAKIVGGYRIVYRNTQTNASSKLDLLVMENLFYGRKISQTFDLKGSVRNRMASGKVVLLDENLLRMNCEKPLYIRPHSKAVLMRSIDNDTHFLAQRLVMDYSLLVGIDDDKKELVCGIIDYIRTFTWDKKLETFVKSSGILGGQGKMPTVVSPELYRTRFCDAMDGYFLAVPDRWTDLGIDVDL